MVRQDSGVLREEKRAGGCHDLLEVPGQRMARGQEEQEEKTSAAAEEKAPSDDNDPLWRGRDLRPLQSVRGLGHQREDGVVDHPFA